MSAASDLTICRAARLGDDSRGNLFSALFNMHKIMRHRLERDGATFACRNEDFLVSSDPDFHPTDVLEDADGSLLVIDTGGWFRIGCPTSQIAKPEVLGAIYRVRKTDARERVDDPRGAEDRLGLAVGRRAGEAAGRPAVRSARSGGRAVGEAGRARRRRRLRGVLAGNASVETKCAAVWALTRIDGDAARAAVRVALDDPQAGVRQAAARAAGLHRDAAGRDAADANS